MRYRSPVTAALLSWLAGFLERDEPWMESINMEPAIFHLLPPDSTFILARPRFVGVFLAT